MAIESAISGGSISLIQDGAEVANWIGKSDVSKAEELLVNIDDLLRSSNVAKHDISVVAVSAGPGSFTGIRIGIATGLGLKAGLGIEVTSESALKAMAFSQSNSELITAAIPMGRNAVCLQTFQKTTAVDEPHTMPEDAFLLLPANEPNTTFVLHAALSDQIEARSNIIDFGTNVAYAIGFACLKNPGVKVEPIFASKSF